MSNKASIRDVSRHAGVSTATVSRAFSDPDRLSEKTLKKVIASAKALNYQPNFLAKTFRTNQSNTILVMVPDLANVFFTRVLTGIESVASKRGYSLLLSDTKDDFEKEVACVSLIDSHRVDGVIQLGKTSIEQMRPGRDVASLPFIQAIEAVAETAASTVLLDNVSAARNMAQHVIDLGHKKFGVIAGPSNSEITKFRLQGIKSALVASKLNFDITRCAFSRFCMPEGEKSAKTLFSRYPDITALICMSDDLAIGASKHLREIGKAIPDDVSIVGFDDIISSTFFDPPLTTMTQPAEIMGMEATTLLLEKIADPFIENTRKVFEAEIIIRKSTQCPL